MKKRNFRKEKNNIYRAAIDLDHGLHNLRVLPPPPFGGISGICVFDEGKVKAIGIPDADNAYHRTVRIHEAIHAQRQDPPDPEKSGTLSYEAIRDVLVHTENWPQNASRAMNRDAACAALMELRRISHSARLGELQDPMVWNIAMATATRSVAILSLSGQEEYCGKADLDDRSKKLLDVISPRLENVLDKIVEKACGGCFDTAQKMLEALFRANPNFDKGMGKEMNNGGDPNNAEDGEGGRSEYMKIEDLPKHTPCNPTAKRLETAPSGGRFRAGRLTHCVINNTGNGLFLRNKRLPGGATLIDASGSMNPSNEILSQLCLNAPAQTVAYYNGDGETGTLRIYAKGGMRFNEPELPTDGGANVVDLPALKWLLEQEGPRWFVTDRGFGGGLPGDKYACHILLDQAIAAGEVTVIDSLPEALEVFKNLTSS